MVQYLLCTEHIRQRNQFCSSMLAKCGNRIWTIMWPNSVLKCQSSPNEKSLYSLWYLIYMQHLCVAQRIILKFRQLQHVELTGYGQIHSRIVSQGATYELRGKPKDAYIAIYLFCKYIHKYIYNVCVPGRCFNSSSNLWFAWSRSCV